MLSKLSNKVYVQNEMNLFLTSDNLNDVSVQKIFLDISTKKYIFFFIISSL